MLCVEHHIYLHPECTSFPINIWGISVIMQGYILAKVYILTSKPKGVRVHPLCKCKYGISTCVPWSGLSWCPAMVVHPGLGRSGSLLSTETRTHLGCFETAGSQCLTGTGHLVPCLRANMSSCLLFPANQTRAWVRNTGELWREKKNLIMHQVNCGHKVALTRWVTGVSQSAN